MKNLLPMFLLGSLSVCGCTAPTKNAPGMESEELNPGERALREGDLDAALDWLEPAAAKDPQDGRLWRALGEAQIRLAQDRMGKASSNLFISSTLLDAQTSLSNAESRLGNDARTAALQTRLLHLQGQVDEAYRWAETAVERLREDAPAELRYEIGRAAAEASFQKYLAMRQEGAEPENLAFPFSRTMQSLLACEKARPQEAWPYERQADLFQWEEARLGVVSTLERGLDASPAEASLHGKLQNYLAQQNDAASLLPIYEELLRKHPQEPVAIWYGGLAQFREADARRGAGDLAGAVTGYELAKERFSQSAGMRPEFQDSVDHYLALAEASRGWCLYGLRKVEDAAAVWVAALRRRPQIKDAADGLGQTVKEGLGRVGGELVAGNEFEKGRLLHKTLVEIDPADADWMNNYAFLCREAGTAADTADRKEEARSLFEESYAAYEKAVALTPDDARLVNDCALILLYHLDRDLDRAEAMFLKSAKLGEAALAQPDLPPATEEELRSATGDAYENLGVLHFRKKQDPLTAREFFRKSAALGPGERPPVQWHLNRIQTMEAEMRNWMMLWLPAVVPLLGGGEAPAQGEEKSGAAHAPAANPALAEKLQKAGTLLEAGSINDALDLLDEVEKESPDLPETNFLYGKAFVVKAELLSSQGVTSNQVSFAFMDGLRYLERAVEQSPTHGEAWWLLGKAHFASNDLEKAGEAAEKATKLLPKGPEAFQLRGEIAFARYQEAKGNDDAEGMKTSSQMALDCFQKAAKLSDRFAPAWEKLGDLYAWLGKDAEAKDAYVKAMGIAPKEATGSRILQRAAATEWVALFEKSLAESKKLRQETDQANALLFWYLGYAHLAAKQPEQAHAGFAKAAQLDPGMLSSQYYLGRLEYFEKKNYAAAAEAFGVYARKDADGLVALVKAADQAGEKLSSVLEFLEGEAVRVGKRGTARDISRVNAFLSPENAVRWNNYAFLCRETGKYEDSYAAYSQAVELDPENPQLLNDCALILQYHLHRDLDRAKEMYEKAIVNAKAILEGKMKSSASQTDVITALRDATSNLAKLKLRPDGEKSGE